MDNQSASYIPVMLAGALSSAVVIVSAWFFWLRHMEKQLSRLEYLLDRMPAQGTLLNASPNSPATGAPTELVAQFKVSDGQQEQTVTVLESDGKRFFRVDGELSRSQRAQMLRYLQSEGFMD